MNMFYSFTNNSLEANDSSRFLSSKPASADYVGDVVSIIDARRNRGKRVFIKAVALTVSIVFLWQQVTDAWSY